MRRTDINILYFCLIDSAPLLRLIDESESLDIALNVFSNFIFDNVESVVLEKVKIPVIEQIILIQRISLIINE